jgi:S1-C subfamily serine protease
MNRRTAGALLLAFAAALSPFAAATAADEKGWIGVSFSVETEGSFFSPTLRSVKIEKVAPASPAAAAGLAVGDVVVALQGMVIAGAKADDMKTLMKRSVGETLRFKIRRGTAEPFEVPVTAAAKPSGG